MAIFQWTDNFCTGLDEVDQQHRRLVDMLNELDEARTIGGDSRLVLQLLDSLADYTKYHFASEEKLMADASFDRDERNRHLTRHQDFIKKVADIQIQARQKPEVVSDDLVDFLSHWLIEHILGTDQIMANLLLKKPQQERDQGPSASTEALILALRESEARFRSMADNVPALIWMSDAQGRRSYYNQQWSQYTGLNQEDLLRGDWLDCIHPDDVARIRELHSNINDHEVERIADYRLRRKDQHYRWFWETTVPRFQSNGTFAGEVSCAIDVTERHQVEKLLRGAKQRLEAMVKERTEQLSKANQVLKQRYKEQQALTKKLQQTQAQLLQSEKMASIGQLAAGVAHEINNPIGYVSSNLTTLKSYSDDLLNLAEAYAELAKELARDDSHRTRIEQLQQSLDLAFLRQDMPQLISESMQGVDRARKIVQDLKNFTRIEQQDTSPFDLEAGLELTLDMLHKDIGMDIDVIKEFAGLEPVVCVGAEMNQVFMYLLTNAIQAIDGQGSITLRTGREGVDWLWVEVQDNGRGIPQQDQGRLFDPFFTTRPVGQGTGMGLALAYSIVDQHGGKIDVESQPGSGSRFRVWLPLTKETQSIRV
jgi:hemerythrin-like metal-binding protein/PAS domain S-box-containing protein